MNIRPIIFGATGMVGEGVLHLSLNDARVESLLVIGRRPCGVGHPKLSEVVHNDFFDYSSIANKLKGYNACFFCAGVTSIGKKEVEYRKLTYDLTLAAALALAQLNSDMTFCYVSGAGTDSTEQGSQMWARVKGKTENDLMKLPFKAVYAFRPGFIKPIAGLKNTLAFAKLGVPLYPLLKAVAGKYVCTLEEVGRSMLHVAAHGYGKKILECVDISAVGK